MFDIPMMHHAYTDNPVNQSSESRMLAVFMAITAGDDDEPVNCDDGVNPDV